MKSFVAGFGFGVAAGLLLAPKRGELTRADVRYRVRKFMGSASDAIANARRARSSSPSKKSPESVAATTADSADKQAVEILNTASRDSLMAVNGIGQRLADRIIENRPYQRTSDVVEKGILPESTFVELRRELLKTA